MRRVLARAGVAALLAVAVAAPAHAEENWRRVTPEWSWPRGEFLDVEATGPNDVWAVGTQGEVCYWSTRTNPYPPHQPQRHKTCPAAAKPIIQHWDGAKWTKHTPGAWSWSTGSVHDVIPVGPGEVYFIGGVGSQTVVFMRWNGTSFENAPVLPSGCSGDGQFEVRDGALTVVGYQNICRLVGDAWQTIPAISYGLYDGSFHAATTYVGPTGVYARRFNDQGEYPMTLARWNGTSWVNVLTLAAEQTYDQYSDFTVFAPDDIWFTRESSPGGFTRTHWRHWDGTSFTDHPVPTLGGYLNGPNRFARDAAGTLTVSNGPELSTRTWRFDPAASTWTELPTPALPTAAGYKITALATVPGSTTRWAVGGGIEDVPDAKTDPLVMTTAP